LVGKHDKCCPWHVTERLRVVGWGGGKKKAKKNSKNDLAPPPLLKSHLMEFRKRRKEPLNFPWKNRGKVKGRKNGVRSDRSFLILAIQTTVPKKGGGKRG